ncbi:MAG: glycosyl transferase [Candidatus Diapherotrites archaeon]|uniref:Glycosyl transferase n=1 Tax=Candidatus Iainarchaeum sp. TaxID=3101447 RepID=A0A2D6M058_9ARCH|nr:glycosyl transferase [Candidatus Diapherotrites archaeon]|tara:strand:+ start:7686 stop:8372 length:687 start_codon:yes stop_codon:yes gene_type:complete
MEKLVSIIVPAYNEESRIAQALEELKQASFAEHGFEKEIIIVNDGSRDNTLGILKKVKGIKLVSYAENRGKGFALRQGFKEAKGSVIAIQDADLEYDPTNISLLLKEILSGHNVVFGSRFKGKPKKMTFTFYFGNKFLSVLTSLLFGQEITDMETCQKVFTKGALDKISLSANGFDIEPELTAKFMKAGHQILELPISYDAREKEEKKIGVSDGIKAAFVLLRIKIFG